MGLLRSLGCLVTVAGFIACAPSEDPESSQSEMIQEALDTCLPTLDCVAPVLPAAPLREWRHWIQTPLITGQGAPSHRGRDLFVNPDAPQTIIAQFAYGTADVDLVDEDVDIYVQRDCGSGWEKLATVPTTRGPDFHPPVEGVDDTGGRVYYEIPVDKRFGPGRHQVRLVVAGDGSSTDLFIDVIPPKTPIFISDVDGTLTSSEYIEFVSLLWGDLPETHVGAPEALRALAAKGYRPIYLTARPEWLVQRTRDFLDKHGFPPGIIHTSTSIFGAGIGASAAAFKTDEIAALAAKGLVPHFGFGNHGSDSDAYLSIPKQDHRIFFQIVDSYEGRRIESYTELHPDFSALPAVCTK